MQIFCHKISPFFKKDGKFPDFSRFLRFKIPRFFPEGGGFKNENLQTRTCDLTQDLSIGKERKSI